MESTVMTIFSLKPGECHGRSFRLPIALSQAIGKSPYHSLICQQRQQYGVLRCRQMHQPAGTLHDDHDEIDDDPQSKNPVRFHPSIWGDFFFHYSNPIACSPQQQVRMAERADKLKKEVEKLIERSSSCSLLKRLHLIHVLQRLCLDHLFEDDINGLFTQIKNADVSGCDLPNSSSMVLSPPQSWLQSIARFKDEDGSFESNCPEDLLSLYNAGYFGTHGETILDEAVSFSKMYLETAMPHLDPDGWLASEIARALEIPLPRRVRIYELKHYISIFEKETTVHETILELAKVNSNLMQLHHQRELKIITRWWKNIQLQSNLSFSRDRIVECYFWMVGAYFEPRYARARIILTMVMAIISIMDDIYDIYGTSEECELFTRCIESVGAINIVCMVENCRVQLGPKGGQGPLENCRVQLGPKLSCILNTYEDIEHELETKHKYRMSYLKFVTIDWVRAYTTEVKWRDQRYVPATLEEHLKHSVRSGACHLLSCASFVGMDDVATRESFEWVSSMPKIVHSLCTILRLLDDPKSYEREQRALHVASTIDSCMKEHNVSMELALKKIKEVTEDSLKSLNEEWLKPDEAQPKELLERIFNLTRSMEFFYKQEDAYTNSYIIKDTIKSLFVDSC